VIPKRDLYKQNYPLAFGAYDENNQNILPSELPKYVTGFLEVRELDVSKLGVGDGGALEFKFIKIFNLIPCVDVKDKTLTDFFLVQNKIDKEKDYFKKYMLCPDIDDPKDLYTDSGPMTSPFRKVEIKIYPCTLIPNTACKTATELGKITIKVASTVKNFIFENYRKDFIETKIFYDDLLINPRVEYTKKNYLMNNVLYNDDQDLFPKQRMAEYISTTE
jgi:hypothetical protein